MLWGSSINSSQIFWYIRLFIQKHLATLQDSSISIILPKISPISTVYINFNSIKLKQEQNREQNTSTYL